MDEKRSAGAHLTRRAFLKVATTGAVMALLESCHGLGGSPTQPLSKSPASPAAGGSAQGLPGSTLSAGLGVNIHFSKPQPADVELIAEAGFGFVRLDFTWASIERQKGVYDFSGYEDLVHVFAERGIRSLIILAYGNPLYDNSPAPFSMGPSTDEVRQAFARFATAAVTKMKGCQPVWEIWNEPNNVDFWHPHPDAAAYMKLVQLTGEAIRQADAHATIIAPAVVTFPQQDPNAWSFLDQCFGLGLLQRVDAVSIHPYRDQAPETVTQDYQRLRTLMAHDAPAEKAPLPICSSEWGYPVVGMFSQSDQAAFFVREVLTNVLNGVPLSIWYDWQDDGPDPQNLQDNFGLLSWDGRPKLAYLAAKTLTKQLGTFHFVERLPFSSNKDYALLFVHQMDRTLVLWTTADPHTITLPVTAPAATAVISITGAMRELTATQGAVTIELTGSPQYVRLAQAVP